MTKVFIKYRKILILIGILVAACLLLYANFAIEQKELSNQYEAICVEIDQGKTDNQELIQKLESLSQKTALSDVDRMRAYADLSVLYFKEKDYAGCAGSGVRSVYLAEKLGYNNYLAYNYLNMADAFSSLGDYSTSEMLLKSIEELDLEGYYDADWIRETQYEILTHLYVNSGEYEKAASALKNSGKFAVEDAIDAAEMDLLRDVRWAQIYTGQGNYKKAEDKLKAVKNSTLKGKKLSENIAALQYKTESELAFNRGDMEEGIRKAQMAIDGMDNLDDNADKIYILNGLVENLKNGDPATREKYRSQLIQCYRVLERQSNSISAQLVINSYGNIYEDYKRLDQMQRLRVGMIWGVLTIMLFMALLVMLLKRGRMDAATGAYNKMYFDKRYRALRGNHNLAVIMLDVDNFKDINDNFGHLYGDYVLREMVEKLDESFHFEASLFRVGGEEFCILAKCRNLEEAVSLAEKARMAISSHCWQQDGKVTVSLGVAYAGQSDDLYALADKNLYQSKMDGRNRTTYIADANSAMA